LELFKGDSIIFHSNKLTYLERQQLNRMLYKVPKVNAKMEPWMAQIKRNAMLTSGEGNRENVSAHKEESKYSTEPVL
jgi:actin-related protein